MNSQKSRKKRKKRKLTKKYLAMRQRRRLFYAVLIGVCLLTGTWLIKGCEPSVGHDKDPGTSRVHVTREFPTSDTVVFNGRFQSTFDDVQDTQIVAAMRNGIEPLADAQDITALVDRGILVRIDACDLYEIDEVSLPYLVPDAKDMLDEIARRYQSRTGSTQPLRLTGCLRTDEHISHLMRRNINSVKNSCHLYGTTIDISYRYLEHPQKVALAQILYEMQQAGHCYVKYERKQPCFHITIR